MPVEAEVSLNLALEACLGLEIQLRGMFLRVSASICLDSCASSAGGKVLPSILKGSEPNPRLRVLSVGQAHADVVYRTMVGHTISSYTCLNMGLYVMIMRDIIYN